MNNFTKEELEKIFQIFNIVIDTHHEPSETYELRDKIQSTIDNYCKHEFAGWIFRDNYKECKHCNKLYE